MTNPASASKPDMLVVDDSRLIRRRSARCWRHKFDVAAADGVRAWAIIEADPAIQVVFSDLDMPRMDGFELRTIRAATDTRVQELPVIIVTGARDDDAARRHWRWTRRHRFHHTKPFASTDLVARARAHSTTSA